PEVGPRFATRTRTGGHAREGAAWRVPSPSPLSAVDDREAGKAKALVRVRQLERQSTEDEPIASVQRMNSGWRALAEGDEPFASNVLSRKHPVRILISATPRPAVW